MSTSGAVVRFGRKRPISVLWFAVISMSTAPVLVQASSTSGPVFSFYRGLAGVLFSILVVGFVARFRLKMPKGKAWFLPIIAGLLHAVSQVLFITAIKFTAVADVALLTMLNPILIALWAAPLFGERPSVRFRAWTAVAIFGAAIVVLGSATATEGNPIGLLMAVISVIAFSLQFVALKSSRASIDALPLYVIMLSTSATAVALFTIVSRQDIGAIEAVDLLYVLGLASFGGGIGVFLMTWTLRWVPANIPPLMNLAHPFLAGTFAWVFLREAVKLSHVIGGLVTLVGVGLALNSPSGRAMLAADYSDPVPPPARF